MVGSPMSCAVVVAMLSAAPCSADSTGLDAATPGSDADDRLLQAIRSAVRDRLAPGAVEARIGRRAVINTQRPGDRAILENVDIVTDDKRGDPVPVRRARDVAYWMRPVGGRNPRIAGILWHGDGSSELFVGAVLPP
jgi:hypothetical protein